MAEERNVGLARAPESSADGDSTKAELQRRMEEARESISQTVTEIKDTVVTQYQQVRENISDTLDWREQYRRRTVPFTVGAFAVGALIGYSVMGAFKGGDGDEEDDAFDRIESGFDRGLKGSRSYAAQPVLGKSAGGEYVEDVGPETRPSYSSGYQATPAPPQQAQGFASYAAAAPEAEEEEPKGPGLIDRFKETKAYDKLQDELSTLGERFVEELSRTARNVVLPALLGKLKGLIGVDLSSQGGGSQQRGGSGQQAVRSSQPSSTAQDTGGGASEAGGTSARAAAGGTEGYGAS
jgi:ElaB/YqjD/DUF883 family membrane-anchored ribosome-binding protein